MNLNSDILSEIFSFFEIHECLKYSMLSKYHKKSIVEILVLKDYIAAKISGKISSVPYYGKYVTTLDISDSDINDNILLGFLKLRKLTINNCVNVTGKILPRMKSLNNVTFGPKTRNIDSKYIWEMKHLCYLSISLIYRKIFHLSNDCVTWIEGDMFVEHPLGFDSINMYKINEKMVFTVIPYVFSIHVGGCTCSDTCKERKREENVKRVNCYYHVLIFDLCLKFLLTKILAFWKYLKRAKVMNPDT